MKSTKEITLDWDTYQAELREERAVGKLQGIRTVANWIASGIDIHCYLDPSFYQELRDEWFTITDAVGRHKGMVHNVDAARKNLDALRRHKDGNSKI